MGRGVYLRRPVARLWYGHPLVRIDGAAGQQDDGYLIFEDNGPDEPPATWWVAEDDEQHVHRGPGCYVNDGTVVLQYDEQGVVVGWEPSDVPANCTLQWGHDGFMYVWPKRNFQYPGFASVVYGPHYWNEQIELARRRRDPVA